MSERLMEPLHPRPQLPGNQPRDRAVDLILKDATFQQGYRELATSALATGTIIAGPREVAQRASEALRNADYPLLDIVNGFVLALELRTVSTKERWADVQQQFIRSLEPGADQERAVQRSAQQPHSSRLLLSQATLSDLRTTNLMVEQLPAEQGVLQQFVKELLVRAQVRTQRVRNYFESEGGSGYVAFRVDDVLDRSALSVERDATIAGQHLMIDSGAMSAEEIRVFGRYAASRLAVALEYSRRIEAGHYHLPH